MSPDARADIAKLIPLLGSPLDGEALAAARAIARKLEARGRTLHDLAALVDGGAQPAPPPRPATRPSESPKSASSLSPATARAMAREIRTSNRAASLLSAWEHGALDLIVTRLDAGLALPKASDALLCRIYARIFTKAEA
ncbi:hypothetical protein NS228_06005 [Methylobacterium indicum]|uniref:hypothetical protein n=1 Tax=Methylobacterium indicum TaxID=1775910 RepID=UPI0007348435|nr:hypothetical protein [Methylobacterium indicum]KTS30895.1 hypothetical protein NS229_14830 [Methylobacterium indicum]KTS41518.1 hypothetical protein NS228_06005 [Methylobacterium indicum]KTS52428.1 hypothetical protein NS230_09910 [Methylobacterium indicum]